MAIKVSKGTNIDANDFLKEIDALLRIKDRYVLVIKGVCYKGDI